MRIFSEKKASLQCSKQTPNQFVEKALQTQAETKSGNGSLKYVTSNDVLTDQFAMISNYKEPRTYEEISKDMEALWKYNPTICIRFAVYVRMITRDTKIVNLEDITTLKSQIGQGLKHEGIFRLLWLAINHKDSFTKNLHLFIAAGSWKDIIKMMSLDLQYHGMFKKKLDWNFLGNVIVAGLGNPEYEDLVKKYLPTIRTSKVCTTVEAQANTLVGKFIAKKLYGIPEKKGDFSTYTKYRKLKLSGKAHIWQQRISVEAYGDINFNSISGRALSLLVGSKFLKTHNLEVQYQKWIESRPVAKFTGYVYELFKPLGDCLSRQNVNRLAPYQEMTINKQFAQLVSIVKPNVDSAFLVVRDTSFSMTKEVPGTGVSSNMIAKSLALYFGELLKGPFHNMFLTFDSKVKAYTWKGDTPCAKWRNDQTECIGDTNFLGVADFLIKMKQQGVPENEFPKGILCVSDGEFNRVKTNTTSNFIEFKSKLLSYGFTQFFVDSFKIVLWDTPNSFYGLAARPKFESFADAPNFFYMSGLDPAAVSFLLGNPAKAKTTPTTGAELTKAALDQDLLKLIEK